MPVAEEVDLFAPPSDEEIVERKATRIRNCKGHRWMSRAWSSGSSWSPVVGVVAATMYLDIENTNDKRYCIDCGAEEPKDGSIRSSN